MTKSEQARADALADAETLRRVAFTIGIPLIMSGRSATWQARVYEELDSAEREGVKALAETSPAGLVHCAYAYGAAAARAAFRAVPGLRD